MVTVFAILSLIVFGLCIVTMTHRPLKHIPVRIDKRRR